MKIPTIFQNETVTTCHRLFTGNVPGIRPIGIATIYFTTTGKKREDVLLRGLSPRYGASPKILDRLYDGRGVILGNEDVKISVTDTKVVSTGNVYRFWTYEIIEWIHLKASIKV